MADSSRPRVTITLGRSGQVVERAGPVFDSRLSERQLAVGNKRSIRDRLGSGGDRFPVTYKRQRGDNDRMNANNATDSRLGRHDLRFKLMQKNFSKQVQSDHQRDGVDLRQSLSRAVQDYKTDLGMRRQISEPMDSRHVLPERRKDTDTMQSHPTRSADVLPRMETLRNSHSPWTIERIRERSPDRVVRNPRNLSPHRNGEETIRRPLPRAYDDVRSVSYVSRDSGETRRPLGSTPYMTKPTMAAAPVKPSVLPISLPPLSLATERRSSYRADERLTVDAFLRSLGLDKYIIHFKAEEVDMATLIQMGERDLKELGIPMGPRKKILLALLPRSKMPL